MKKFLAWALLLALVLTGTALAEEPNGDIGLLAETVLIALESDLYRATYEGLLAEGSVANRSKGETALGVQQTLIDLGGSISADGAVGPKTLAALNEAQTALGIAPTEELDADGYLALLEGMLLQRDPDVAEQLIACGANADETHYRQACALDAAGYGYRAQIAFASSSYADSAERAAACAKDWPETGVIYRDPAYSGKKMVLNVAVDPAEEGTASAFKIYAENGDLAAALFFQGSDAAQVRLPGGAYTIKMGVGDTWYGLYDAFGREGSYQTLTFDDGAAEVTLSEGRQYTLTISDSSDNGRFVGSESVDWEEF